MLLYWKTAFGLSDTRVMEIKHAAFQCGKKKMALSVLLH